MNVAIIAFTQTGGQLLNKIVASFDDNFCIYNKNTDDLKAWINEKFVACDSIIFIGAVGIAVRLISKHITTKDKDPAVIVIDEKAQFVIPILSGHIGGANALAIKLGEKILAVPVITTATDINNKFAVDVWATENNAIISHIGMIKHISAAALESKNIGFYSDFEIETSLPNGITQATQGSLGIAVSLDGNIKPFDITLNVIPQIITIGIGCKKDTDTENMERFILKNLSEKNISLKAVQYMASIDLKKNENCLVAFAEKYNIKMVTFTSDELNTLDGDFTSSQFVKATTGTDNVCERSAILQSGGNLIMKKTSENGMTIALAKSNWRCKF